MWGNWVGPKSFDVAPGSTQDTPHPWLGEGNNTFRFTWIYPLPLLLLRRLGSHATFILRRSYPASSRSSGRYCGRPGYLWPPALGGRRRSGGIGFWRIVSGAPFFAVRRWRPGSRRCQVGRNVRFNGCGNFGNGTRDLATAAGTWLVGWWPLSWSGSSSSRNRRSRDCRKIVLILILRWPEIGVCLLSQLNIILFGVCVSVYVVERVHAHVVQCTIDRTTC